MCDGLIGLADYSELKEYFEQLSITSVPVQPSMRFRYVDDTFVKIDRSTVDDSPYHNGLDSHINFISESEAYNKTTS